MAYVVCVYVCTVMQINARHEPVRVNSVIKCVCMSVCVSDICADQQSALYVGLPDPVYGRRLFFFSLRFLGRI